MKSYSYCAPYIRINAKWISNLNIRAKTIELLEENIGVNIDDLGLGNGLLDVTLKHKQEKK